MRVSTSLNVFDAAVSRTAAVRRCAEAGFRSLDMNYWDYQKQVLQMSREEEQEWAEGIRAAAEERGLRFTQMHGPVHGPTYSRLVPGLTLESFGALVVRSIRTAGILGVPWVVFHPTGVSDDPEQAYQEVLDYNIEFYRAFIPELERAGVGIALENMHDRRNGRTYFTRPEELAELIDKLNHPLIGACWDTGHAHLQALDQAAAIRTLGHRLKATHIQDNNGSVDQHILPYQGSIRWSDVAGALHEIGYAGDFTYEAHNSIRNLPDGIRDAGLKYALELGNHIIAR